MIAERHTALRPSPAQYSQMSSRMFWEFFAKCLPSFRTPSLRKVVHEKARRREPVGKSLGRKCPGGQRHISSKICLGDNVMRLLTFPMGSGTGPLWSCHEKARKNRGCSEGEDRYLVKTFAAGEEVRESIVKQPRKKRNPDRPYRRWGFDKSRKKTF